MDTFYDVSSDRDNVYLDIYHPRYLPTSAYWRDAFGSFRPRQVVETFPYDRNVLLFDNNYLLNVGYTSEEDCLWFEHPVLGTYFCIDPNLVTIYVDSGQRVPDWFSYFDLEEKVQCDKRGNCWEVVEEINLV